MVVNDGDDDARPEYEWNVPDGAGCAEVWEAIQTVREEKSETDDDAE